MIHMDAKSCWNNYYNHSQWLFIAYISWRPKATNNEVCFFLGIIVKECGRGVCANMLTTTVPMGLRAPKNKGYMPCICFQTRWSKWHFIVLQFQSCCFHSSMFLFIVHAVNLSPNHTTSKHSAGWEPSLCAYEGFMFLCILAKKRNMALPKIPKINGSLASIHAWFRGLVRDKLQLKKNRCSCFVTLTCVHILYFNQGTITNHWFKLIRIEKYNA